MSPTLLRVLLAQLDFQVGDIEGNYQKVREILHYAQEMQVELLIFPEMSLSGYPIQDLIFDRDFYESEMRILNQLSQEMHNITLILGGFHVETTATIHPPYQNVAYILTQNAPPMKIAKRLLPTYDVFDENRYFWPGQDFHPILIKGIPFGITICEDLWNTDYPTNVAEILVQNGAKCIISINGSPYHIGKQQEREQLVIGKVRHYHIPFIYVNAVGGNDELVFDGQSFVVNSDGHILLRGPFCQEALILCEINTSNFHLNALNPHDDPHIKDKLPAIYLSPQLCMPHLIQEEEIIQALVLNLRDYFQKTGIFQSIVFGLSGGIDSAFTAYIATLAVGKEKVIALLMPSRYSSSGSIQDSVQLCQNLGIRYHIIPIKNAHELLETQFSQAFEQESTSDHLDLALQNLQARLRGIILMFYSNKYNALLISTGNKSEIAMGYCTLYGDTNGGKNIPGDLYKTQIYRLVHWINRTHQIIPETIVNKIPSAELKPNQTDQDTLPPYPLLDEILNLRIDEGYSPREIIKMGYDLELIRKIERMYTMNEYKRAQLVQTIKINKKTFGIGRKIPILKRSTY